MPGAPTGRGRRRRGLTYVRTAAYAAPVVVLAGAVIAATLRGWWLIAGLAVAVLTCGALGALVLHLERRTRTAVAATRAKLAAQHSADQARHGAEHRSFTEHMVGLLDAASVRVAVLRRRVDSLEREITTTRFLQRTRPVLAHELSAFSRSVAKEWPDLWPELAEAPTVVDFVAWDQRTRTDSGDDALLARGERARADSGDDALLARGAAGDGLTDDGFGEDWDGEEPQQKSA